jgi:xanthine dehydrogenase YagT iron-sulfur-binding subunit
MNDQEQSIPSDASRRDFLLTMGSSAAAAVITGCAPIRPDERRLALAARADIDGAVPITLRINGKDHHLRIDPRTTLLDCIRETVAFTGTKKGCDHGQCGACTVHVSGRRVNSCLSLALMHDGEEITTIEGLGTPDALHPMQRHSSLTMATSADIAPRARLCRPWHCSKNPAVPLTPTLRNS